MNGPDNTVTEDEETNKHQDRRSGLHQALASRDPLKGNEPC